MAKLKVKEIGRNWWTRQSRRDIYINEKHSGILAGEEIELDVKSGPCKVTVQNRFPTFSTTTYINIEEKADTYASHHPTGQQCICIPVGSVQPFQK